MGLLAAAAGCGGPSTKSPENVTVATVAGQPISQALLDYYIRVKAGVSPDKVDPALRESLLSELRRLKAAAIAGESKAGPDIRQQVEVQRLETLARSAAAEAGVLRPPSDSELRLAYTQFAATVPSGEYHVAHILKATEPSAIEMVKRLQARENFAKLARAESADDSRIRGGDIGWIALGSLPAAFMSAVQGLKPGSITEKPVHTPYGWHTILLLEVRTAAAPPYDQVKAQLAENLQQQHYRKFLDDALQSAR
jgi:peptidyl-prolyl cis-trans isomerase C